MTPCVEEGTVGDGMEGIVGGKNNNSGKVSGGGEMVLSERHRVYKRKDR